MRELPLKCEKCGRYVEALTEDAAESDFMGHGWNNWETAISVKCYDCVEPDDPFRTYYAGRIKIGQNGRVFICVSSVKDGREVESYFIRYEESAR